MLSARNTFNLRNLASHFINSKWFTNCRGLSSKTPEVQEQRFSSFDDEADEEEIRAREAEIEKSRNKSGLYPSDYNKQHDRVPYEEPLTDFHESLLYRRRMYGKYGEASKVNPSILWPSKKELAAMREYEEVAQPFTFQQLVSRLNEKKAQEQKEIEEEEQEILKKVSRVNEEKLAFHKRVQVQKQKALEAFERKQILMNKVYEHFGYKLDTRDQRFKDMLEKLLKEEKKAAKAAKKAMREEKLRVLQEQAESGAQKIVENTDSIEK